MVAAKRNHLVQVFAFSKLFLRTMFPWAALPLQGQMRVCHLSKPLTHTHFHLKLAKIASSQARHICCTNSNNLQLDFFPAFPGFIGIFFILQIQLVTAHFVACPSDAAITPWKYMLFVWPLVQRHLYLQDLMQRLVWSQLCLPTGATPHVHPHLWAMDKGSQQRFGTVSVCRSF